MFQLYGYTTSPRQPSPSAAEAQLSKKLADWWASDPAPSQWAEVLEPHLKDPAAAQWVRSVAKTRSPAGLHLLRQWRALQFFDSKSSTLLVAWPVVIKSTERATGPAFWRHIAAELDDGLSAALLPEHARSSTLHGLWGLQELLQAEDALAASWLQEGWSAPFPALSSAQALRSGGRSLLLTRLSLERQSVLEKIFFTFNPATSRILGPLALRIEAQLEEEGLHVKLLPATAIWNAFSLVRLAHARYVLGLLTAQKRLVKLDFDKAEGVLKLHTWDLGTLKLDMPEEGDDVLAPLLARFCP
jgi:hypothetical protein